MYNLYDCENAILNILLTNPILIGEITKKLIHKDISMFTDTENKMILKGFCNLADKEISYDPSMCLSMLSLELSKLGALDYISKEKFEQISSLNVSKDNLNSYIGPIIDAWKIREAKNMVDEISKVCGTHNCSFSSIQKITQKYSHLETPESIDSPQLLQMIAKESMEERRKNILSPDEPIKFLSTGFNKIDQNLLFRQQNIYVIAGRPGSGKTTFVRNAMWNMSLFHKKRIYFASLEMSKEEILEGFITKHHSISSKDFNAMSDDRKLELEGKTEALLSANRSEIIVDDYSMELSELINNINIENKIKHIDAVFIDYLQLINVDGTKAESNTNSIISFVLRALKKLAKRIKAPVILLSQLNRNVESRENKRPLLSDLRDSGSIEQDATAVLFLYRDEYYNKDTVDKNILEVIFGKNRFGKPNIAVKMKFEGEFGNVEDL